MSVLKTQYNTKFRLLNLLCRISSQVDLSHTFTVPLA